ncbi:MAG: S8 family serine peptidase [Verrucomicrobia bacterium]|nr:S8 family serine peptidase [Verrucomicrobiota bacterium]
MHANKNARLNRLRAIVFTLLVLLGIGAQQSTSAQATTHSASLAAPHGERFLVKPKPGADLSALHESLGVQVVERFPAIGGLQIVLAPGGVEMDAMIRRYEASGLVNYAEHDHTVHALVEPNDFRFHNGDLWHLKNIGQYGGVTGADISATEAWETIANASNVIVAVIDSGVRATHEDLAPNLWRNPGEIPGNGLDDDGNGYVDDVHGINTVANNGNPDDEWGHGTHVAGILGAVGNNGVGVVGVCWRVQIMVLKFFDSPAQGPISDAIKCIDYARSKGAHVINASWGSNSFHSLALRDAIASARDADIIFVAAAGNAAGNNDVAPLYPASYDLDNIISVAATTRTDALAFFSNYGATTVDLGAPGAPVFSCWNSSNNAYQNLSGTSMAAPIVAGACALARARYPQENYQQIIQRILNAVDPLPGLAGKCVTGGRLNLQKLVNGPPTPADLVIQSIGLVPAGIAISWSSQPGRNYEVHGKGSLSVNWQNLSGIITATNTVTSWTDNGFAGFAQRFYMVKMVDQP